MDDFTPRRSGRARKPKKFEGFEVKVEKIDPSYGDVEKPESVNGSPTKNKRDENELGSESEYEENNDSDSASSGNEKEEVAKEKRTDKRETRQQNIKTKSKTNKKEVPAQTPVKEKQINKRGSVMTPSVSKNGSVSGKDKSVKKKIDKDTETPSSEVRRSSRSTKGQRSRTESDDEFVTPVSHKSPRKLSLGKKKDDNVDESEDEMDNRGKGEKAKASVRKQRKNKETKIGKNKTDENTDDDSDDENGKSKRKRKRVDDSLVNEEKEEKRDKKRKKKEKDKTESTEKDESTVVTEAEETWSFVKTQFETLSNILWEGGIENVILTSLTGKKNFEYQGSEKGYKFLENRVGNIGESTQPQDDDQVQESGGQTNFVWKIVEKQARNVVKLLSDVGVDSLMLTSVMSSNGFGCVGSTRGLEFLNDHTYLADLFVQYCNGTAPVDAELSESSVFGCWYKFFTGEEIEERKALAPVAEEMDKTQLRQLKKEASALYVGEDAPDIEFSVIDDGAERPVCPVCNKSFKSVKIFRKHYLLHSSKKTFVCEVCNKAFMRKYDCQQHMVRRHDYVNVEKGEVMRREVAEAREIIKNFSKLKDKDPDIEGTDDGAEILKDGDSARSELADNQNEVRDTELGEVNTEESTEASTDINRCTSPGEVDMTKISLEEIKKENMADVDLSVTWELEQGQGDNVVELDGSDKITCPECGKKLKNVYMLQKHLENHASDKNVECLESSCKKKFKRKYDMEYHLVWVHGYVKLGPGNVVPKDQLPENYKDLLRKLKRKKKRRGKGDQEVELSEDENEDPIEKLRGRECPVCHMVFKSNIVLKRHYVIHTGKKDFICEVCSKCFLRKYDMQTHQINVHGYQKVKKGQVVKPDTSQDEIEEMLLPLGMNTHTQGRKRKVHKCPYCDIIAFTLINMDIHLEQCHREELPFSCKDCDLKFETKRKMKMHWYFTHKEKKHKCQYCDKTFTFRFNLRDHEQTHSEEGGFLCGSCGKSFPMLKYLKKHEQRHHGAINVEEEDTKMYTCRYCSETLQGLGNFQTHMRTHNSELERKFQCETCHKRFFTIGHLKRHEFVHKDTRDYPCDLCDKSYKDPDTLKKHQIASHNKRIESRQVYVCPEPECGGRGFLSMGHLKRHMLIHKGIKPHKCEECGRSFTEKATLQAHIRTHTGEKPYTCKECGRSFTQQSHLRRHMYLHTQVRNCVCQICGRAFYGPEDLKKHMLFHSEVKPHKCQYCSRSFHHPSSLRTHLRSHMGESFKCDICGQEFTQKNSMLIHRRRHTGEKPFKCSECGKCFVSKQLCKIHLRSHFPGQYPRHECPTCKKDYSSRQKLRLHIMKEHSEEDLSKVPNYREPIVLIVKSEKGIDGRVHEKVINEGDSEYESYFSEEEAMEEDENQGALTCDICFLKFPDRETVQKHKVLHDDQKDFECQICLEVFETVARLHQHLMSKHGFSKLENGDVVRRQMEPKIEMDFEEAGIKTVYVEVESPTKYLNKPVRIAPKQTPISLNQNTLIKLPPTSSIQAGPSQSLLQNPGTTFRIAPSNPNVNQRRSFNIVEKDGTILHIVSPYGTKQDNNVTSATVSSTTTSLPDDSTYLSLPQTIVTEEEVDEISQIVYDNTEAADTDVAMGDGAAEEIQTIVVSESQEEVPDGDYVSESGQDDGAMKTIINYQMEDAMQYVQEEVIETQVVPEAQNDLQDPELESAISQIAFDQGGGITELTAANLAALYGTDKIIYQEERSDGTEVVHVYAVVQKDENNT